MSIKTKCVDCQKVIWRDCLRCRPCHVYQWKDKSLHPNWRGGKPNCQDCGKRIGYYAQRCRPCSVKYRVGMNAVSYKNGKPKCIDCGIAISYGCNRCQSCNGKFLSRERHHLWKPDRHVEGFDRYRSIVIRSRSRGWPEPDKDEFIRWIQAEPKMCHYCGIPQELVEKLYHASSNSNLNIDRKNSARGYEQGNIVLACGPCNLVKSKYLTYDEMRFVGEQFMKLKWQRQVREGVVVS